MEVSLSQQLSSILISFATGIILGVIYDVVRIVKCLLGIKYSKSQSELWFKSLNLNKRDSHSNIKEHVVIWITDIIFFIISGVVIAISVYYSNNGVARWYMLASVVIGFVIYYFTIGKIVIRISNVASQLIKTVVGGFLYLLTYPFYPLVAMIKNSIYKVKNIIKDNKEEKSKTASEEAKNILLTYGK